MGTGVIVTMAGIALASTIAEAILIKSGKTDEAKIVAVATVSGLALTAITHFIKLAKLLRTLG